jgi:hypothetical protein
MHRPLEGVWTGLTHETVENFKEPEIVIHFHPNERFFRE